MGEQVADWDAALPVLTETPGRFQHLAYVVELRWRNRHPDRVPMLFFQARLRIERIHLEWDTVHKKENDALSARLEVRRFRRKRVLTAFRGRKDAAKRRIGQ